MVSRAVLAVVLAVLVAPVIPAEAQLLLAADTAPAEAGGTNMVLAGAARLHSHMAMQVMTTTVHGAAASRLPDFPVTIAFDQGSARLTPGATRALDQLGVAASGAALSNSVLRVEGHADSLGAPDANMDLSRRRAQAVAQYLEQNFGFYAGHLVCVGLGDRHPLVRVRGTAGPEPRNRVVRLTLAGDG